MRDALALIGSLALLAVIVLPFIYLAIEWIHGLFTDEYRR